MDKHSHVDNLLTRRKIPASICWFSLLKAGGTITTVNVPKLDSKSWCISLNIITCIVTFAEQQLVLFKENGSSTRRMNAMAQRLYSRTKNTTKSPQKMQEKHDLLRRNRTSLLYHQHIKKRRNIRKVRRGTNSGIKTYGSMLNGINPSKMETFFA